MQHTFSPGWFRSVSDAFLRARRGRRIGAGQGRGHVGRRTSVEPLEVRVMLATTLVGAIDETGEKDF